MQSLGSTTFKPFDLWGSKLLDQKILTANKLNIMLKSQAQQTMLAISSYLINLLFNTSGAYHKTLRLKAYSDTLKKHIYGILDYTKMEFFFLPMLWETHNHCLY